MAVFELVMAYERSCMLKAEARYELKNLGLTSLLQIYRASRSIN